MGRSCHLPWMLTYQPDLQKFHMHVPYNKCLVRFTGRDGEKQSSDKVIGNAKKFNHQTNFLFCTHLHVQVLFKLINLVPDRWLRRIKTLGTRMLLAFKEQPRPQFFSLR